MNVFSRLRRHKGIRYAGLGLAIFVVVLLAAILTTLTIDLGPGLRTRAEREGTNRMKRPVHVGSLTLRLLRGRVELNDLVVDGLHPGDRPFFAAKRLSLSLDWAKALARRPEFIITSVEMTDWTMLVEKFKDGDSFPRFRNNAPPPPARPSPFTTTLKSLRAWRGHFAYEDHEHPWSVDAPNIDISITNQPNYHGTAAFTGGTVAIQRYLPMWANFKTRFSIEKGNIVLDGIEIETDGARTYGSGVVDAAHWPEQTYQLRSRLQFPRMRELFFASEQWVLSGDGDFDGTFHLFSGGHDLAGTFKSEVAGLYDYRFPALNGSLHWTRNRFEVTDAGAKFMGGDARFAFAIAPLGSQTRPAARFETSYANVDLAQLSDFYNLPGLRMAGRGTGSNLLEWPLGRFREHTGEGRLAALPPAGIATMTPTLTGARPDDPGQAPTPGKAAPPPLGGHVPVAGEVSYRFGPDLVELGPSRFATERTHVSFAGTTRWGGESAIQFHVASRDWQESDQVLAGILTDFGAPTRPVAFGGRGEFDGRMSGPFRRPRVEGLFSGEGLRAWDTLWGDGSAQIVVENSYVTVTDGSLRRGAGEIRAEGLFSLGYPRRDKAEEINARIRIVDRDLDSLRHAFELDDWPVTGRLTGEFHLAGAYQAPIGFGAMTVDDGVAYGETFEKASASLRFDGVGVRLDSLALAKGTGTVTGAAFIGWDGTYSFNADGRGIPLGGTAAFAYPRAQPSGLIEFFSSGSSTFADPRYDVRFRINEVFVGEEPVGQVTGTLALRGEEVSGEFEVASPRLALTGTGRIDLTPGSNADLTFRFHDSSLDPYVRLFVPRLTPYTTAVASGSLHVAGPLAAVNQLAVDATVDRVEMRLFDYAIRSAQPIKLSLDQQVVTIEDLQLVGDDTSLIVGGSIALQEERIAVHAQGDANLGILQGFFSDVRGAGRAALAAAIDGPLYQPVFSGSATIADGRIRHFSLPNSLDAINGTIRFDSQGIALDDVAATMGGGRVQFGGRIGFEGYLPGDLNVIVRGEDMHLRYPEGVRSTVDADLAVRGNVKTPTLAGTVIVKDAAWTRRIDATGGLLDFSGNGASTDAVAPAPPPSVPIRFDIQVQVPSTLRVENNLARLVARADLQLRGTYDRPLLFGRAEVERGEVTFEGRRYLVTRGNIDFTNPSRIEPFFDVEAETRVRVPGQTYQVTVRAVGTLERLQPELSSDPPLPTADVLALLFSDVRRTDQNGLEDAELRALQNPNERQRDILTSRATQMLANPVSAEVGRVVEQTFGVDTFQLTPSLLDPYNQSTSRVNPSARVTIGKRISERVYLTFSRSLSSSMSDQILLLEYDESERLSWILSRNEDSSYAIEVRVRHSF